MRHSGTSGILAFVITSFANSTARAEPFVVASPSVTTSGYFDCHASITCTGEGTSSVTFLSGERSATLSFTGLQQTFDDRAEFNYTHIVYSLSPFPFTIGAGTTSLTADVAAVPEPATLLLVGTGLLGAASAARRCALSKLRARFATGFRYARSGPPLQPMAASVGQPSPGVDAKAGFEDSDSTGPELTPRAKWS